MNMLIDKAKGHQFKDKVLIQLRGKANTDFFSDNLILLGRHKLRAWDYIRSHYAHHA